MGMDMATGGKGTSGDISLSTRSSSCRPSEWKTSRALRLLQRETLSCRGRSARKLCLTLTTCVDFSRVKLPLCSIFSGNDYT